jgi:dipeptidyl aminopeptidase/acylaminoacyl peptidase
MWHFFPGQYMPSYQVNRALTQAHYGGGEFAEILEVAAKIDPSDRDSFNTTWLNKGNEVLSWAEAYEQKGAFISARRTYLRAFNYLRTAEFFMNLQNEQKLSTYTKAREAFISATKYFDEKPLQIEVPFEAGLANQSFLPGYLFKPAGIKNPPVMVMFGGLDSLAEELYFGIGNHLMERGIALLAVDGPGQGAALRLNHIHSRYDYEVAGTAVLEYVIENLKDEVDTTSIGIAGVSMGGYMAARCAAFEPRFKVCMIFGAVWSYYSVWAGRNGKHPLAEIVMHIMDANSYEEVLEKLKGFTLENGVAEKISMPTFIMHGGGDKQNFVEHAINLEKHLTCEHKMKIVPEGESGAQHCQVDDFMPTLDMYDWIAEKIKA